MSEVYDVIIVGGGPGGTTTGTLLKKYNPALRVLILEREKFPREHIGESQLPIIGRILEEMGVWGKVEAAGFIVKLGASYTWGKTTEPWTFNFIPPEEVVDEPRPGRYAGWRQRVAFQVDRAIYDEILLRHAASLGCEVRESTPVVRVLSTGNRVDGLELGDGSIVTARYYVDASGNAAVLRRALGVKTEAPTLLQNIAFWDYWSCKGMNGSMLERGSIRIRIRSVPFGWIWYIALSEDRTSIGLVCPADYFKKCGKTPEMLYKEALALPPDLQPLLAAATRTDEVRRTNDWSFVAETTYGENWFLCGEALGFADPILSAGMTLTHTCARHLAYTILELERAEHDAAWLKSQYNELQRLRVVQHMKFAEYWYTGNGQFRAVEENCAEIARHSGLKLTPSEAFRWLSNGGIDDDVGQVAVGGYSLSAIKGLQWRLSHTQEEEISYAIDGKGVFRLKTDGATDSWCADLHQGRVLKLPALERNGERLVIAGVYGLVYEALKKSPKIADVFKHIQQQAMKTHGESQLQFVLDEAMQCLEMMVARGWVAAFYRHGEPVISMKTPLEGKIIYSEETGNQRKKAAAEAKSKAKPRARK